MLMREWLTAHGVCVHVCVCECACVCISAHGNTKFPAKYKF